MRWLFPIALICLSCSAADPVVVRCGHVFDPVSGGVTTGVDVRIEGDSIVVSSPSVPNPTQVRYAWQSNPAATLFNGAGLPAAPFRTDIWPAKTEVSSRDNQPSFKSNLEK